MAEDGGTRRAARPSGEPALLRAVGQMLIAMADERIDLPPEPAPTPEAPPPAPAPQTRDDVDLLLAQARQRAHRVIEDSVIRANELLRHEEGRGDWRLLERMRRSVNELGHEVHDIQDRLRRIEELLLAQAAYPAERSPSVESEELPVAEEPQAEEPTPTEAPPAVTEQPEAEPAAEEPAPLVETAQVEEFEASVAEFAEREHEEPPVLEEPKEPLQPEPAPEHEGETAPGAVAVATAEAATQNGASAAEQVRFTPEQGSVVLRVAPVAGFHGLMRVQDALAEVAGVREAGVEAYAQGEARLRVRLADPIEAGRLADALGSRLGVATQVLAASEEDRSVRLRFD